MTSGAGAGGGPGGAKAVICTGSDARGAASGTDSLADAVEAVVIAVVGAGAITAVAGRVVVIAAEADAVAADEFEAGAVTGGRGVALTILGEAGGATASAGA